jgi:hypothetical protein
MSEEDLGGVGGGGSTTVTVTQSPKLNIKERQATKERTTKRSMPVKRFKEDIELQEESKTGVIKLRKLD